VLGWLGRFEIVVQHIGVEVGPIRPPDRPEILIDCDLGEERVLASDLFKYRTPKERREVYNATRPIGEGQLDSTAFDDMDSGDLGQGIAPHGNGSIVPGSSRALQTVSRLRYGC